MRGIRSEQLVILSVLTLLVCGCMQIAEDNPPEFEVTSTPEKNIDLTESDGVRIIVCKNFGRKEIINTGYKLTEGDCAMDALQSVANVETAYGGGFVNDINGISSGYTGSYSTKMDWFYYINGISADRGGLEYILHEGDVERWDYHDWGHQMFIPAIIGDYPEPFLHGVGGEILPTIITYDDDEFRDDAHEIENSLNKLGVKETSIKFSSELSDSEREDFNIILIGYPTNKYIKELMKKHKKLGFFAYSEDNKIVVLNPGGERVKKVEGAVILATQNPWNPGGTGAFENVVWIISGTDEEEIGYAAGVLSEKHELLQNHFGIFIHDEEMMPVPCT